jgi:uncharacterized protein DUF3455
VQVEDGQIEGARRRRRLRAAAAGVAAALALGTAVATAGAASADTATGPAGAAQPASLRVGGDIPNPGPGFRVKFAYWVKEGTQTYTCDATGAWGAKSVPEAKLYAYGFLPPVHHYAGPRWTAKDGSTIVGTVDTTKTVPQEGTIPWLLLDVTGHEGPAGQMSDVTDISRVHTRGGAAPTGACTAGQTQAVPYGADYVFWTKR